MNSSYQIFKKHFRLKCIKKIYNEKVSKKQTRGIDRIGIKKFNEIKTEQLKIIYRKCQKGDYVFSPYIEKLQNKGRNKNPRAISVSTVRDRIVLYILKDILHEIYPECVNRKLPNNYIKEIKDFYGICGSNHICYFKTDIKSFYDSIDHETLFDILRKKIKSKKLLNLINSSIKTPTVPIGYKRKDRNLYTNYKGIPQGLSISNILANIYLLDIDKKLNAIGIKYIRYVDDIILFITENEQSNIENRIKNILDKYSLSLNDSKTLCQMSDYKFEYLGYQISKDKTSIKPENIQRFLNSVAAKFASFLHNSENFTKKFPWIKKDIQRKVFLEDINEKITGSINETKRYGWLFHFIEIDDMELLHKLDNIIQGFFSRLNDFDNKTPTELKKLSKAYYKAKYHPKGGYIHNYDKYETIAEKMNYLSERGHINPNMHYKMKDIEIIFERIKARRLKYLDLDVGIIS